MAENMWSSLSGRELKQKSIIITDAQLMAVSGNDGHYRYRMFRPLSSLGGIR